MGLAIKSTVWGVGIASSAATTLLPGLAMVHLTGASLTSLKTVDFGFVSG
jgi:hypothetical protein